MPRIVAVIMVLAVSVTVFNGCGPGANKEQAADNATSGSIKIAADESVQPIIAEELDAFMAGYPKAQISAVYTSEGEAMRLLLADSIRMAVMLRMPTTAETAAFEKQTAKLRTGYMARDGVALILHPQTKDTLLTLGQIRAILTGDLKTRRQLNAKAADNDSLVCVFDRGNAGNINYMQSRFALKTEEVKGKVFAAGSNTAVIEYVRTHPGAIGFIGVNWISDLDAPTHRTFSESIRVASISDTNGMAGLNYYQPDQASLKTGEYPLRRELILVSREGHFGLASGFMTYALSHIGQRIVLKSGLMPAMVPGREVHLNAKISK